MVKSVDFSFDAPLLMLTRLASSATKNGRKKWKRVRNLMKNHMFNREKKNANRKSEKNEKKNKTNKRMIN